MGTVSAKHDQMKTNTKYCTLSFSQPSAHHFHTSHTPCHLSRLYTRSSSSFFKNHNSVTPRPYITPCVLEYSTRSGYAMKPETLDAKHHVNSISFSTAGSSKGSNGEGRRSSQSQAPSKSRYLPDSRSGRYSCLRAWVCCSSLQNITGRPPQSRLHRTLIVV